MIFSVHLIIVLSISQTLVSLGQSIAIVLSCKVRSLPIILRALQNSAYLQALPAVKSMNPLSQSRVIWTYDRVPFCVMCTCALPLSKNAMATRPSESSLAGAFFAI